jgi:hypothetical protein
MASDRPGILMRHRLAKLLKDHGETEQRRPENQTMPQPSLEKVMV